MREPQSQNLKRFAQETLLKEIRVTPEMRARLERRIGREEAARRTRPSWWVPAGTVTVAAALLLVVGLSQYEPLGLTQPGPPGAEIPPVAANPPPLRTRPVFDLDGAPAKVSLNVKALDENGAAFTVTTVDAYGNTVGSAVPAPSGIPGVEAQPGQQIVRNADYTLEVKDAQAAMATLQAMATGAGGYVVEATLNQGADGSWAGRLLLRIPAAQFSGATERMADFGKVTHQRQWSQDVTDQYTDLQSRLKVLQEHEQKLQELALKAANFDDWLRLAKQINETRTQVENLQGTLKQLANRVEYSTLNIGLVQPAPGQESVAPGEGLGRQMGAAFGASIRRMVDLGRSFLVGLAGATPLLVPMGMIAGLGLLWLRRRRATPSGR